MYEGLYLKAMLVALLLWSVVFLFAKNQRKEMITIGLFGAIAGPIQELWYTKDYWQPAYIGPWPWIEDILFGFVVLGSASIFYEKIFSFRLREVKSEPPHPFVFSALLLITGFGMGLFVQFVNSIYAAMISFLLSWAIILFLRSDLLVSSLWSAITVMGIMFIAYQIVFLFAPDLVQVWWKLENISGILMLRIPLEEYLWFFTMGLVFGPLYEFWKGIRFMSSR